MELGGNILLPSPYGVTVSGIGRLYSTCFGQKGQGKWNSAVRFYFWSSLRPGQVEFGAEILPMLVKRATISRISWLYSTCFASRRHNE